MAWRSGHAADLGLQGNSSFLKDKWFVETGEAKARALVSAPLRVEGVTSSLKAHISDP